MNSLVIPLLAEIDVLELLSQFKASKAPGHDGTHMRHVQQYRDIFGVPLQILFNMCIENAVVPEDFKVAVMRPVHKSLRNFSNYRPISLLPTLDNILARHLSTHTTDIFNKIRIARQESICVPEGKGELSHSCSPLQTW